MNSENFLRLVNRVHKLEEEFEVYATKDLEFKKEMVRVQRDNTKVLNDLHDSVKKHAADTGDLVQAWTNVKGAVWVLNAVGKSSLWLLKTSAVVAVLVAGVWAWLEGVDQGK